MEIKELQEKIKKFLEENDLTLEIGVMSPMGEEVSVMNFIPQGWKPVVRIGQIDRHQQHSEVNRNGAEVRG